MVEGEALVSTVEAPVVEALSALGRQPEADDRSLWVEAQLYLLDQGIGSSHSDQAQLVHWRREASHPLNKSSGRDRYTCDYRRDNASFLQRTEYKESTEGLKR